MSSTGRRSNRTRKANPKYAHQGWDRDTLRLLRESSESSGSSAATLSESDNDLDNPTQEQGSKASSTQPNQDFAEDAAPTSVSDGSGSTPISPAAEMNETGSASPQVDAYSEDGEVLSGSAAENETESGGAHIHSRGLQAFRNRGGPRTGIQGYMFGPELNDLYPVLVSRDTWLKSTDITLPSQTSLGQWVEKVEIAQNHTDVSCLVYNLAGAELDPTWVSNLQSIQRQKFLQNDDKLPYLPHDSIDISDHKIITGPFEEQKANQLAAYQAFDLDTNFRRLSRNGVINGVDREEEEDADVDMPDAGDGDPSMSDGGPRAESTASQKHIRAWLLNLGEKVQALAWQPARQRCQYLAVAVRSTKAQREAVQQPPTRGPPAFTRSPPYPAAIQIWKFETYPAGSSHFRTLDMMSKPKLIQVICTNLGDVRQLEWWTIRDQSFSVDGQPFQQNHLNGWLAALYSDGVFRVFYIDDASNNTDKSPAYILLDKASISVFPPEENIFTSMTIVSKRDVVLGTDAGTICVYDLQNSNSDGEIQHPTFHYKVHNTYVMSICSAALSGLPHILFSTSAAGEVVLIDLRAPAQDFLQLQKTRLPSRNLVYAPFTRSVLLTANRTGNTDAKAQTSTALVAHNIRHCHITNVIVYLPEFSGSGTALAASKWHPCILMGNARGSVFATNYLRRVIPQGRANTATAPDGYLQRLCEYEWRPLSDKNETDSISPDLYHGHDVRDGISRFHEGFKPEKINIARESGKKKKKLDANAGAEVIFEEEQAVSIIQWNPNSHCAGIVAIGWASGILRIQDVSHDA